MTNRLADSSSPYLRQHADDPVEWMPWGEKAFELAARLGRPLLLSCGYSACHWCHVMQRESFRDPETAALINSTCVPVKVDRELRPDVDALYQSYVASLSGRGGWPLTVWLTPEKLPLFGGTYFPADPFPGQVSFRDALRQIAAAWTGDRADVDRTAEASRKYLQALVSARREEPVDRDTVNGAIEHILNLVDLQKGGIGGAPKFPQLPVIELLCNFARLLPDPSVLRAVRVTMLAIVRGGIYDQVGGGVHRYAVDADWRTPHFEKMLPDQGLLLSALARAAALASDDGEREEYGSAARGTAALLRREFALPGGGLAASLAADAGGVEGATYTWTRAQLAGVLDERELALATSELGAPETDDERPSTLVSARGRDARAAEVDAVLAKLAAARGARPQPPRDGKLITAWNALAARGLMEAGTAFGEPAMIGEGVALARLLSDRCTREDGVVREPTDASVADVRLLEDAALLVAALLSAHAASGEAALLERAEELQQDTLERFSAGHVLYQTPGDTDLPVRPRDDADSATPSGTGTVIENAVRLGVATGDRWYFAYARGALEQLWSIIDFAPQQAARALSGAVQLELAPRE